MGGLILEKAFLFGGGELVIGIYGNCYFPVPTM